MLDDGTRPSPEAAPPGRPSRGKRRSAARSLVEWLLVILGAIAAALLIKTFAFQAFFIPSVSMEPVLAEDDRVLVNKFDRDPARGDIVVFERADADEIGDGPDAQVKDLIKRVIGLPGESITIADGNVFVDGRELVEPYLPDGVTTTTGTGALDPTTGQTHTCADDDPCLLPEGFLLVLGDNRGNSQDSRYREIGYVSMDQVIGRAFVRIWPLDRLGGL